MRSRCLVIVPFHNRLEMLYLCLENLLKAEAPQDLTIFIALENKPDSLSVEEVYALANQFPKFTLWTRKNLPHSYYGNSFNVLSALRIAHYAKFDYVFIVEDDMMVTPDFFRWSLAVHQQEELFAAFSIRERRKDLPGAGDPQAYCTSYSDYTSTGVCFPDRSLPLILQHCGPDYYGDMHGYCKREFTDTTHDQKFCEQDGLIMNVMLRAKGLTAFPSMHRCFHVGYYGYNRMAVERPEGTLEERVALLRNMIVNYDLMNEKSPHPDCQSCKLEVPPWDKLVRVAHFD